ncbi:dihydrofolate reductase [bacterium]|nr:dihydrofolate reductase [bacterium]
MIELITACAADAHGNLVIGNNGGIPWHIPNELRLFREKTLGHPIVMGRKTYESIGKKPLADRQNIILTEQKEYMAPRCTIITDAMKIIDDYKFTWEKCFIIGGADIYNFFWPYADKIHVSKIDLIVTGDTLLPFSWKEMEQSFRPFSVQSFNDEGINWRHSVYERIPAK